MGARGKKRQQEEVAEPELWTGLSGMLDQSQPEVKQTSLLSLLRPPGRHHKSNTTPFPRDPTITILPRVHRQDET